jgi:hypothetical protein
MSKFQKITSFHWWNFKKPKPNGKIATMLFLHMIMSYGLVRKLLGT